MNVRFIIGIFLAVFLSFPLSAQNVVLSGKVTDAQSGEPLIGVTVYNTDRRTGTTTNSSGQYNITLPSGRELELVFSYVGYASETQTLILTRDTKLDIQLRQDTQNLREVQVYGTRNNFGVQSSQMSAVAVSAEQIKKMPTLLGEVDVLKSLQRLPGVQSSGEGRSGIYVRGGDYDQNLFLMDGIT
ncbi:MAG: carboxypeptidase-like regulatory domain-containing protein, partial [Bacteroidaceae bacterium]|nr:carboxypeptidase-like regulatory domain-containing protein [Bacteroidaceae bacterium]